MKEIDAINKMKEIDARGIDCPMPVIMARREIKAGFDQVLVRVDNEIATENLKKMAGQIAFDTQIKKINENDYEVRLRKKEGGEDSRGERQGEYTKESTDYIVVFDSNTMGGGDQEFGKILVESFMVSLSEQDIYPSYIVFYNKGVELTSLNENTIADLKKIEDQGVQILSCGLCLDYYKLTDDLKVGQITNMYNICQLMSEYRVVKI